MLEHNDFSEPNYYEKRTKETHDKEFPIDSSTIDLTKAYLGMIRWHWHAEIEFDYMLSGTAYFTCGTKSYLLHPGEAIFINQNVKHSITPDNEDECTFYHFNVHPSYILGFGMIALSEKFIYSLLNDPDCKSIIFHADEEVEHSVSERVISSLQKIKRFIDETPWCYQLDVKAELLLLWSTLCKEYIPQDNDKLLTKASNQDEYRIKQAILYIQDHFSEPITLDDISDSIMVSKSECCRCFKRCLHVTPFEYLMRYRITESTKQMHFHSISSISDIASSVGFNNTSYYNKIFKKYMNCTPTEYRKQVKKDIPNPS